MNNRSKVSIIIPVYNVEKYLGRCINSVLNQTYKNIELILIDDGSTDRSGKICDDYGINDNRIQVIHKKNSGVSLARNLGINISTGDYIQFIDSDDFVEPIMTEKMLNAAKNNSNLVICGMKFIYKDMKSIYNMNYASPFEGTYQIYDFMKHFGKLYELNLINSTVNKLYVSNIIKENKLKFVKNLDLGEDLLFNLEYITSCKNITIIKDLLYYYSKYIENSLTTKFNNDTFGIQQKLFLETKKFLLNNNSYSNENQKIIENIYTYSIIGCLSNLFMSKNNLTSRSQIYYIKKIVLANLGIDLSLFYNNNIQKRIIGFLIKNKLVFGLFCYFKIKVFLKNNTKLLFRALRVINQSSQRSSKIH